MHKETEKIKKYVENDLTINSKQHMCINMNAQICKKIYTRLTQNNIPTVSRARRTK